jgi:hypothetical protein
MSQLEERPQTRVLRFEQNRRVFRIGAVLLLGVVVALSYATRGMGQGWWVGALGPLIVMFLGHSRQIILDGPRRMIRHRFGLLLPFVTIGSQEMSQFDRVWIRIVDEGGTDSVDLWFGIGISGQSKNLRLAIRRKHAAAVKTATEIAQLMGVTVVDASGGRLSE